MRRLTGGMQQQIDQLMSAYFDLKKVRKAPFSHMWTKWDVGTDVLLTSACAVQASDSHRDSLKLGAKAKQRTTLAMVTYGYLPRSASARMGCCSSPGKSRMGTGRHI